MTCENPFDHEAKEVLILQCGKCGIVLGKAPEKTYIMGVDLGKESDQTIYPKVQKEKPLTEQEAFALREEAKKKIGQPHSPIPLEQRSKRFCHKEDGGQWIKGKNLEGEWNEAYIVTCSLCKKSYKYIVGLPGQEGELKAV